MKYPVIHLKITMKSAEYLMKNCNEMHWLCNESNEKSQWNTQWYIWKITMKSAEYLMKNCNEMYWLCNESNEKSQWNTLWYIWKITMKSAEYLMKNRNEMHWVCNERYHVSIEKSPLRWLDRLMKCLLRISHILWEILMKIMKD